MEHAHSQLLEEQQAPLTSEPFLQSLPVGSKRSQNIVCTISFEREKKTPASLLFIFLLLFQEPGQSAHCTKSNLFFWCVGKAFGIVTKKIFAWDKFTKIFFFFFLQIYLKFQA